MKYGSVCSGIEAATVAWHPLGWEPAFFSEIEAFPSAVLAHHYPKVENRGDMTKFKEWKRDAIDVLVGGTPCQSFSVAGLRKGLDDPRGNLALVFLAIIDRLRPKWLVWENVPGVRSTDEGRGLAAFLGGLSQLGYGWAYRSLDAQYFGLAQRRERVFVVGHLGDWRRAGAVLLERQSLSGDPAPSREAGKSVAPSLETRAGRSGGNNFNTSGGLIENDLAKTLRGQSNASHREDTDTYVPVTPPLSHCLNGKGGSLRMDAESETLIPSGGDFDIAGCLGSGGKSAGSATMQDAYNGMLITHSLRADGFDASEDGTGRGIPLIADTLLAGSGTKAGHGAQSGRSKDANLVVAFHGSQDPCESGDVTHPCGRNQGLETSALIGRRVRRLTPRECERLQGFPDDYTLVQYRKKPAADGPRYKAIGNSMAVPVMNWIGKRIAEVETL